MEEDPGEDDEDPLKELLFGSLVMPGMDELIPLIDPLQLLLLDVMLGRMV